VVSMRIGILTRNENAWCSLQLKQAIVKMGAEPLCISFEDVFVRVGCTPRVETRDVPVEKQLDAIIVRPVSGGSLEEIIFRMDLLHRVEALGVYVVNPPTAIERAADKFYALALLEDKGICVPRTLVAENPVAVLKAFKEFNGDIVFKPLFGSRGVGVTRVKDRDTAFRISRTLSYFRHVIYIQEFIPHGYSDVRAFVVGDKVVAAMRRLGIGWKTNVAQGAIPKFHEVSRRNEELAVKAAKTLGCEVAGVDMMETEAGECYVNEVNSQPDWRGLQSVSKVWLAEEIIKHVLSHVHRCEKGVR